VTRTTVQTAHEPAVKRPQNQLKAQPRFIDRSRPRPSISRFMSSLRLLRSSTAIAVVLFVASLGVVAMGAAAEVDELALLTTAASLVTIALGLPRLLTMDREPAPDRRTGPEG
jgi:hypothetical protein